MIALIVMLFCLSIFAENNPSEFYKSLEITFVKIQMTDLFSTLHLNYIEEAKEVNPLVNLRKPLVVIGIKTALTAGCLYVFRKAEKKHKLVGTIALIALNALGSYVLYQNFKSLN